MTGSAEEDTGLAGMEGRQEAKSSTVVGSTLVSIDEVHTVIAELNALHIINFNKK